MQMKGRMVGKLFEISEWIADFIDLENPALTVFPRFSLAIETNKSDVDPDSIEENSSGWYGIHRVETGFDSEDLHLVVDYYGGGAPMFVHIFCGLDRNHVVYRILNAICGSIQVHEGFSGDAEYIVKAESDIEEKTKIVVVVSGGIVSDVYSSSDDVDIAIIDTDVQEAPEDAQSAVGKEIESLDSSVEKGELRRIW